MKRWLIHLTIFSYLSCLAWGFFTHATQTSPNSSPAMYYIVWDMYCGWNAFSKRHHVIAQGESGKYYELAPGPWGEYQPYGYQDRRHYAPIGAYCGEMGMNTLNHTSHEPISRIYIVEESWAKKFNIPDNYWDSKYDEPKEVNRYCHLWQVLSGEGEVLRENSNWLTQQSQLAILNNPRLQTDSIKNRPFYAVESQPKTGNFKSTSHMFSPLQQMPMKTVNGN